MPSLYQSPLRITWNPGPSQVILVDFGDDLDSLIEINGQKIVQTAQRVRADSVETYDRGNSSTTIKFAKRIECASLQDALTRSFNELSLIPSGAAIVRIEVQGNESNPWRMNNAVIGSWDGGIAANAEIFAIVGRTLTGSRFYTEA